MNGKESKKIKKKVKKSRKKFGGSKISLTFATQSSNGAHSINQRQAAQIKRKMKNSSYSVVSPYVITWAEIRPLTGSVVTLRDSRKLFGMFASRGNVAAYVHFANKLAAKLWIVANAGKFSKRYAVRLFTDAQFGRAEVLQRGELAVKFTTKQKNDIYFI